MQSALPATAVAKILLSSGSSFMAFISEEGHPLQWNIAAGL